MRMIIGAAVVGMVMTGSMALGQSTPATTAAGMLPPTVDCAVLLDLKAFDKAGSLMSYVPLDDVRREYWKSAAAQGVTMRSPVSSAYDAAMRLAFAPGDSRPPFTALALGIRNPSDSSRQIDYAVLTGGFTRQEGVALLRALDVRPAEDQRTGVLNTQMGPPVYIRAPKDGVLLLTRDREWLNRAVTMQEQGEGLTGATTSFARSAATVSGSRDMLVFLNGAVLADASAPNPMVATFMGPFTRAEGLVLAATSGMAQPELALHTLFPNSMTAQFAQQYLSSSLQLGKSQVLQQAEMITDASMKVEAMQLARLMEAATVEVQGNSTILRLDSRAIPDRATVRKRVLENMGQVVEAVK